MTHTFTSYDCKTCSIWCMGLMTIYFSLQPKKYSVALQDLEKGHVRYIVLMSIIFMF